MANMNHGHSGRVCDLVRHVLTITKGLGNAFALAADLGLELRGGERSAACLREESIYYNSTVDVEAQCDDIAQCIVQWCLRERCVTASRAEIAAVAAQITAERIECARCAETHEQVAGAEEADDVSPVGTGALATEHV